jgi:hypothetical protein
MGLRKSSVRHAEIGSVATRMLWIPAVVTVLVVGYLVARTPPDGSGQGAAIPSAHAAAPVARAAQSSGAVLPLPETAPVPPDEAVVAHQLLDPVGAGHDVAR